MAFAPSAVNQSFPPINTRPCGPFRAPVSMSGRAFCRDQVDDGKRVVASAAVDGDIGGFAVGGCNHFVKGPGPTGARAITCR